MNRIPISADAFNRNEREAPDDELLLVELTNGKVFEADRPSGYRHWHVRESDGYVGCVDAKHIKGWKRIDHE